MNRMFKFGYFVLLLTAALSSVVACADTLSFTLSQPTQLLPLNTGGVLSFYGTIAAPGSNTALIYLNGDTFNIGAPLTLDDSAFLNAPLDLAPGQSFTGLLFAVDVPINAPYASVGGTFTILGGPDSSTYNALATQAFNVVTPEPSSWLLMSTGVFGAVLVYRKRVLTNLS